MYKKKQMYNDLIEIFDEEYGKRNLITPQNTAEKLTAKGYRKASEVVEEVIDEIFKILDAEYRQYDTETLNDTLNKMYMSSRNTVIKITAELVELKKKYTEEGK